MNILATKSCAYNIRSHHIEDLQVQMSDNFYHKLIGQETSILNSFIYHRKDHLIKKVGIIDITGDTSIENTAVKDALIASDDNL